jgi:hypothetical protein
VSGKRFLEWLKAGHEKRAERNRKMSKLPRTSSYGLILLLLFFPSGKERIPKIQNRAELLLDESENLERQLDETPSVRAHYLVNLCKISAEIHSHRTKDRCLRAFRFAKTQLPNCEGEKRQVKSLVWLSEQEPVLAMKLVPEVLPWCERFGDLHPEDKVDGDSDDR